MDEPRLLPLRPEEPSDPPDCPRGRVWIQPLNQGLLPTHDAADAHAYLVYNGYGNLEGFVAARLVGYLTARTYRKVPTDLGQQFVNGSTAYLVADQATCERATQVDLRYDAHHRFDADEPQLKAVA